MKEKTHNKLVRFISIGILILSGYMAGAQTVDEQLRQARQTAYSGDYSSALNLCTAILNQNPDHFETRLFQSRILSWNKEWDRARADLVKLDHDYPKNKSVHLLRIALERWSNQVDSLYSFINQALVLFPDDPDFLLELSQWYLAQAHYQSALRVADSIIYTYGANRALPAQKVKLNALLQGQKNAHTLPLVDSLISIYPEEVDLYLIRSKYYATHKAYKKAEAEVQQAFLLDAKNIATYHQVTNLKYWQSDLDSAVYYAQLGLGFHERDETLKLQLAKIRWTQGQFNASDSITQLLLRDNSNALDVWKVRLNSQLKQAQSDSVIQHTDTLQLVYPGDEELLRLKVLALAQKKQFEKGIKAIAHYQIDLDSLELATQTVYTQLHYWNKKSSKALEWCDHFLTLHPSSIGLLQTRALIQQSRFEKKKALETIAEALQLDSNNVLSQKIKADIEAIRLNTLGGYGTYDNYSNAVTPSFNRTALTLEYLRHVQRHVVLGRLTLANRFDSLGTQFEIDAYPVLSDGIYVYTNLGVSNNFLFPQFRLAVEPFVRLPASFEASFGFRYLQYPNDGVLIYTGSIANYLGDFWVSFRPYFNFKQNGLFQSYTIRGRYFLSREKSHIEAFAGIGSSPDNRYLDPVFTQNVESRSFNVGLGYQQQLNNALYGKVWGIYDQYYPGQVPDFNIISLNLGVWWMF